MSDGPQNRNLSTGIIFAYGLPGLIAAIPIIPIAILLPSYYAVDLGLGFTLTGIALGFSRLLDFFSDILVGIGVDRFRWPGNGANTYQYKPWLILGSLIAALGLYMLANPNQIGENFAGALYLAFWSSVLLLGWTLLMVPYTAWGAELSSQRHERSKLTIARESAGLIGMLLALGAPALITQTDITPIALVFWLTVGLGVPILTYTLVKVPESGSGKNLQVSTQTRLKDIAELLKYRPFRFTLSCWFLNSLANGVPAVLFPIVAQKYLLFDDQELFFLLFLYFGAGVAMAPLWLKLAERWGKIASWRIAIFFNVLVFSSVLLIEPSSSGLFSSNLFYWICTLSGMSLSADMALPASLQADVMENDRKLHNKLRTGTAFALWSMATKLALAAAILIGFVSLGLDSGTDTSMAVATSGVDQQVEQVPSTVLLLALYVCLPIALKLIVLRLLGKFPKPETTKT